MGLEAAKQQLQIGWLLAGEVTKLELPRMSRGSTA
jgi:hypothetical protein